MILILHTTNKTRPMQPDCLCAMVGGLLSPLTYGAAQFRRAACRWRAYLHSPFVTDGLDMTVRLLPWAPWRRKGGGIAPSILNIVTRVRWVVSFTLRTLYPVGMKYFRHSLKVPPNTNYSKEFCAWRQVEYGRWGVSTNLYHLQEAFCSSQHQMRIRQWTMNYNEKVSCMFQGFVQ